MRQNAKICGTLHVTVAAEDIGTTARHAHVAKGQLQDAICTCVVIAVGVLRATHTPDHRAWTVVGHGPRNAAQLVAGCARNALNFLRSPFRNFGTNLVHAPNSGADEFFIFPAIFKDVPQKTPNQRHVTTRTHPHVLIGMRRGAGKARVTDDQRGVVLLFGFQDVQQRNRMGLGWVATNQEYSLGIVNVVIAVGHGAVAPCVCHPGHRCRMTDSRLVIDVISAPVGGKFPEQIGLFIAVFGAAQPIDAVGSTFLADGHHAVANLVDRLLPADALPFPALFFHRVFQAALAMCVLAHGRPFGAMRTKVKRAIPTRLLAGPDAVLHLGDDSTSDRAMRTN